MVRFRLALTSRDLSQLSTGLTVGRPDHNFALTAYFGALFLRLVVLPKLELRMTFGPLRRNENYLLPFPPYRNQVMKSAG
jgi:hypothetical protein